jgi:hypothetical protein
MVARALTLALDLPGHGLSDGFAAPPSLDALLDVLNKGLAALLKAPPKLVEAPAGLAPLAERLGARFTPTLAPPATWPDFTPDRYGSHLTRVWGMARAEVAFAPWDAPSPANARAFAPAELNPHRLHRRALAALRAQHVPELMALLK